MIESFLEDVIRQNMVIFPYDERAAKWHAQERARLSAQGQMPPYVDGQIAAITKVNGLVLVTRNTTDFEMFSDLKVQNWHTGV
jgi:tRNA(fMet)-specific endonuclease VapC